MAAILKKRKKILLHMPYLEKDGYNTLNNDNQMHSSYQYPPR